MTHPAITRIASASPCFTADELRRLALADQLVDDRSTGRAIGRPRKPKAEPWVERRRASARRYYENKKRRAAGANHDDR